MDQEDLREVESRLPEEPVVEDVVEFPPDEDSHPESEPTYSEVEQKALEKGWKPKSEFDNPDRPYIEADEFLRNEHFIKEQREMRQMLKKQEMAYKREMRQINRQLKESKKQGYEQALRELTAKRREAIEFGDVDAFNDIDSQYSQVQAELNQTAREIAMVGQDDPQLDEALSSFQERNGEWFNAHSPDTEQMMRQAIDIENYLLSQKPYLTVEQRLGLVEKEIRSIYKDKFDNPKKTQPAKVVGGGQGYGTSSSRPGKISYERLDDSDKRRAKIFMDADPSFTFEDFVEAALIEEKYRK